MKLTSTDIQEYNGIKVGSIRSEQCGNVERLVMCKGINIGDDKKYYAHWQFILRKTRRPSGKSTSFLTPIN